MCCGSDRYRWRGIIFIVDHGCYKKGDKLKTDAAKTRLFIKLGVAKPYTAPKRGRR